MENRNVLIKKFEERNSISLGDDVDQIEMISVPEEEQKTSEWKKDLIEWIKQIHSLDENIIANMDISNFSGVPLPSYKAINRIIFMQHINDSEVKGQSNKVIKYVALYKARTVLKFIGKMNERVMSGNMLKNMIKYKLQSL